MFYLYIITVCLPWSFLRPSIIIIFSVKKGQQFTEPFSSEERDLDTHHLLETADTQRMVSSGV